MHLEVLGGQTKYSKNLYLPPHSPHRKKIKDKATIMDRMKYTYQTFCRPKADNKPSDVTRSLRCASLNLHGRHYMDALSATLQMSSA